MARSTTQALAAADLSEAEEYDIVVTVDAAGGQERRFAARPLSAPSRTMGAVAVDGGLLEDPGLPEAAASVRDAGHSLGGGYEVQLAAEAAEWLRWIAQRAPLQRARVELCHLPVGADWEDRLVLHEGLVRTPTFDLHRGRATFGVGQEALDGSGRAPDRVLSRAAISTLPSKSAGIPVPILYGSSVLEVAAATIKEATDDNRVLVAGHHVRTTANAVTVHRDGPDGKVADITKTAVNSNDDFGNPYAYVVLTDAQYWADSPTNQNAYAISLDAPGRLGGTRGLASESEIRLIGDVLLDLLQTYGTGGLRQRMGDRVVGSGRIDAASFAALNSVLPIAVSAQLTEQRLAVDWVRALVADLPVTVEWVGGVLRAFSGTLRATARDEVVARLTWGAELLDLLAPYEEESVDEVANDIEVRFARRNRDGSWSEAVQLYWFNDAECRASASRYGSRPLSSAVDLWMVEDEASAQIVARELVARHAHVRTRATYLGETRAVRHLQPFDRVEVSDPVQGADPAVFIVERLRDRGDGGTEVGLASRFELGAEV